MTRRAAVVVVGLAFGMAVAGAGCGGGGGGGSGGAGGAGGGSSVPTSVPGGKRISDLTPAERNQLCADLQSWAMDGPFLTNACNSSAWFTTSLQASVDTAATDADLVMTCEGLYTSCVANGVTSMCSSLPTTCSATVSEYFTCLDDTTALLGTLPACSAVTRASVATNVARVTNAPGSAACMSVQNKCPGAV